MNGFSITRLRQSRQSRPPGVALVVVVALVGLLTLLTVSLLTLVTFNRQTHALEAESRSGEMLAQAAFHAVLADLSDEMEKGAASVTESRLEDGTALRRYGFLGKPAGLTVSRAVKSDVFENTTLVKQSASGVGFHSHGNRPPPRASGESTAAGSDPLDPSIWAKPRLLKSSLRLTAETAPDWVYLTRDGSNPVTFSGDLKQREVAGAMNPRFVIGRYAFNLYDTSGLLDLNAAGHPDEQPGDERVGHKGTLALADLAGLPGMSKDGVTQLTSWKHRWAAADSAAVSADGGLVGDDYIRRSEGSGWQLLAANDNLFLSRQDMLRLAKLHPEWLGDSALPLFTHFTRDLDAPSWAPHPKRRKVTMPAAKGGNDAYGADDQVNPDTMAFSKERQTLLLPRRFPLERLRWVATPGKDGPENPAKAERYFGLRWATDHWVYTQARPNGDLYTLQDVPAEREPNFFEILRATVLCGSLGRQYGAGGFAAGAELTNWSHKIGGIDGSINLNIMEMGACLIDQADSDSYPTAISLRGSGRDFWAFGKEDVPYLYRTIAVPYRTKRLAPKVYYANGSIAPTECYEVAMALQVGMWRPHQPAQYGSGSGPVKFRIRPQHVDLYSGSVFFLQGGWRVPGKSGEVPYPPAVQEGDYTYWGGPNYRQTNPELFPKTFDGSEFIELSVPSDSTAFREPQTLHSDKHAQANGYTASGATVAVIPDDLRWPGLAGGYRSIYGFLAGKGMTARMEAENGPSSVDDGTRLGQGFFNGQPIEFLLEYLAEDGSWRPYQRAEFSYFSTFSRHYAREPYWKTAAWHWGSFLVDPRTARFGGIGGTHQGWCQSVNPLGAPQTGPDTFAPRLHWPEGAAMRWEEVQKVRFDGAELYSGVWSWWRQPAPSTGWNFNGQVEWWMNMNHVGCLENNKAAWDQPFTLAYQDPDGVLRPGVGADNVWGKSILGNPMSRRYAVNLTNGKLTKSSSLAGRPRVLNRPFRSVGELAHAFRGTPWHDIDFLNGSSPDAGLLDVFSLYEDPARGKTKVDLKEDSKAPVVAGRVNLNTADVEVIAALLRGAAVDEGRFLTPSLAAQLAGDVHDWLHATGEGKGALTSKGGLVASSVPETTAKGLIYQLSNRFTDDEDRSINDRREVAVRALAGGTTVRAWNFMLDLVVQTGQVSSGATSLGQFQAAAERRFWVHFAIDRPTGQILAVQWEPVVD